jgi:predicted GNAT superfamily acetyltransferase
MFHHPGDPIVLLCGGATTAARRGRGVYKAMLAARAQAAQVRGAEYLAVEVSPESQPILARLGFVALSTLVFYERSLV